MKWLLLLIVLSSLACAVSVEQAKEVFLNATVDVAQVKKAGLPYASLEDTLLRMNDSLVGRDEFALLQTAVHLNESVEGKPLAEEYFRMIAQARSAGLRPGQNLTRVVELGRWIAEKKVSAFDARDALEDLGALLVQVNVSVNMSLVDRTFEKARDAFESERYDEVFVLVHATRMHLAEAESAAVRERTFAYIAKKNITEFVKRHTIGVIVVLAILAILGVWGWLEFRVMFALQKEREASRVIDATNKTLQHVQEEYFAGKMGRFSYRQRMEQLRERGRKVKAELAAWKSGVQKYRRYALLNRFRKG
ncbi:hypothetical protein HY489_05875 [Candidatus Woesearchaeota archaeon]|nr:hypothetical protein [Candidatus Woesearchaeota archaeon]